MLPALRSGTSQICPLLPLPTKYCMRGFSQAMKLKTVIWMNESGFICSFCRHGNWGPQRGRGLSKVTQLVIGKVGPSPRPPPSCQRSRALRSWVSVRMICPSSSQSFIKSWKKLKVKTELVPWWMWVQGYFTLSFHWMLSEFLRISERMWPFPFLLLLWSRLQVSYVKSKLQIPYCCLQPQHDFILHFYKAKFLPSYHFISKREMPSVWSPTF